MMNRDLFLAILAMDVYNRGYGQGIKLRKDDSSSESDEIGSLGKATILTPTSEQQEGWIAAGFYALAYDVSQIKDEEGNPLFGTDGTVISYRGTDNFNFFDMSNDIFSGWTVGADGQGGQAPLAH